MTITATEDQPTVLSPLGPGEVCRGYILAIDPTTNRQIIIEHLFDVAGQ
jgi:hypothetical protein